MFRLIIIFLFIFFSLYITKSFSAEYINDENTSPKSASDISDPISENFISKPPSKGLFPYIKDNISGLPPFISDSHLEINTRSFYFDRSNSDESENVAWALGGSLNYESGRIKDIFSIGAELFTSQKLYGPEDKGGTQLLKPVQESFTVLGRAYAKLDYKEYISASLYRQYFNLPYVNKNFSRMAPNTFEGYTVTGNYEWVKFIMGYISKMKNRNSDTFISMSEAAGVDDVDHGLYMLGALYTYKETFAIGAINYFVEDVINIFYSEANFAHITKSGFGVKLSAQYTNQRSTGKDLLTGSDFNTFVFSNQLALSYKFSVLRFAFSKTSNDSDIFSPFGGYPGYISLMEEDFDSAGEKAFLIGLSYNFGKLGLDWLSFYSNYAFGYDAINTDNNVPAPDQKEFNITLDIKPRIIKDRDIWLRLRYANLDTQGEEKNVNDFRIILNYNFTVL